MSRMSTERVRARLERGRRELSKGRVKRTAPDAREHSGALMAALELGHD